MQHAHNPVDWYPWGEEAFARARDEQRPIFLSVGYATCHWCHVMERESFEDDDIAAFMNRYFVNVKVDREEHPDVDQIYMNAVQRMAGQGGWPMSVWLTPDLKPFHAGTYFPPEDRWGRPGFFSILKQMAALWERRREDVLKQGEAVVEALGYRPDAETAATTNADPIHHAVLQLERGYDATWGGFGEAPKFPRSTTLMLILRDRLLREDKNERRLGMVDRTLEMMWRGGLFDHLAGGFARYSTDDMWLVPHFEKMLYDNALLALAYLEGWQATGKARWRHVGMETLDWALNEMRDEGGAFHSALDADSEGEEGLFYVWDREEIRGILDPEEFSVASRLFGLDDAPPFEGKWVLHLAVPLEELAQELNWSDERLEEALRRIRGKLLRRRAERERPSKDDKVLTSWNGLMIAAMARCGAAWETKRFVVAAREAAEFVLETLRDEKGLLLRRYRDGDARYAGTLEDYAFFTWGLLELLEATGEARWLEQAAELTEKAIALFADADEGGFFFTAADAPHIIQRMKDPYDGATPSGESVMAVNLIRLSSLLGEASFRDLADRTLEAHGGELNRFPMAYPMLLMALDRRLAPPAEIVVAIPDEPAEGEADAARALLRSARAAFLPHAVVLPVTSDQRHRLEAVIPWLRGKDAVDERATAWVCREGACRAPVHDSEDLDLP